MRISRRDFVKSATASGIALSITPLAIAEEPNFAARETLPGRQGWNPAATGVGRIDGVAQVREPSFTHRIFVQPISPTGRRPRRTPCSFVQPTRHTFTKALTFRA